MTIVEYYQHNINNVHNSEEDFRLFTFRPDCYVGFDKSGNLCVVIPSTNQLTSPLKQKTRLLSIECNVRLVWKIEDADSSNVVHIIRCLSTNERERELFLELVDAMIPKKTTTEEVIETFNILNKFFSNKLELSDAELIGLYAELDAIVTFNESLNLVDFWQSKDRMKFDFSFTDRIKLEVKSTLKQLRSHHFKHEQLASDMYDIYILSYMLRPDDEGKSLYDLILQAKPILLPYPKKLVRIDSVLKNVSEERLKNISFSPEYTEAKRHFYKASSIPRFPQQTPDGVANAEYDCSLEGISYLTDQEFITYALNKIAQEEVE